MNLTRKPLLTLLAALAAASALQGCIPVIVGGTGMAVRTLVALAQSLQD